MNFAEDIISRSDDGYVVLNASSELLFVNKSGEDFLFDFGLSSVIGSQLDLKDSKWLQNLKQAIALAFEGTKSELVIEKGYQVEGQKIYVTCTPVLKNETIAYVIVCFKVLPYYQDSDVKYQSVVAQLKAVLASSECPMILIDERFRVLNFNEAAFQQSRRDCGYSLKAGNSFLDLVPDGDLEDFKKDISSAFEGNANSVEKPFIDMEGNTQQYAVRYQPVVNDKEKVIAVLISVHDNSIEKQNLLKLKKAEYELKQSNKELLDYKYAVDISSIVSVTDVNGVITYVNPTFCKVSGFSKEELIGQNHSIMKSDYHSRPFFNNLWSTIKSGKVWQGEILNKTKSGEYYWLYTYIIPFTDEKGIPYKFYSVRYDITKVKKSKQLLQESLKQKEALLAEVYHRVKNNLSVVISLLSLQANRFVSNSDAYNALMESKNRIYTMALVHEKLYQTEDLEKIDFKEYVTELFSNLSNAYNTEIHKVEYNIDSKDYFFSLETCISLGLILNELFSNTMKHGFAGKTQGVINLYLKEVGDGFYELKYSDSGCGLNESATTTTSKLGLKLVKALISQIRGEIEFPTLGSSEYTIKFKA
ncbi:MAG TPA: histidine kinase dimerization/phosphoacceptor domain -containing protein [Cytophagaceae bacterium]